MIKLFDTGFISTTFIDISESGLTISSDGFIWKTPCCLCITLGGVCQPLNEIMVDLFLVNS